MYSNETDELKQQIEQLQEEMKKWKDTAGNLYEAAKSVSDAINDEYGRDDRCKKLVEVLSNYEEVIKRDTK